MSQQLISRNADLKRLRDEGFDLRVRAGYLLVCNVPYATPKKEVRRGTLVSKLVLAGDRTNRPDDHIAHFEGQYPCHADGREIDRIRHVSGRRTLADGVAIDHSFSAKPQPSGFYDDYYSKMTTYVAILSGPAEAIDPTVTARTFEPAAADEDTSVFNYVDTASSRAEIDVLSDRLAIGSVAIVGLGGSGSYVLDLVAKTRVREIHLFDGDLLLQHNAFRAPGAPSMAELEAKPKKVEHFKRIYSHMHRGIVSHDAYVEADNVEQLRVMQFVFLCLDRGGVKRAIVDKLDEFGISFIDVGMGVYMGEDSLGGVLRTTTSTPACRGPARTRIPFSDGAGHNEYARNIQIADLNALNAALAVVKWKKLLGFYADFGHEHSTTYTVELQQLQNEDQRP